MILNERIKLLLTSYSEKLKENELLKEQISLLEKDFSDLKASLNEKKELLEDKNDDTIFVSMLIDDLLAELSVYSNNFNKSEGILLKDYAIGQITEGNNFYK